MDINVYGMTCGKCESKIETALLALPGVSGASANRSNNKVTVSGVVECQSIEQTVVDLGYSLHPLEEAITEKDSDLPSSEGLLFDVSGMTCASCVRSVESALTSVPRAISVSVNFANNTALVTGPVDPEDVIFAVGKSGYGARLSNPGAPENKNKELRVALVKDSLRSCVALVFAAVLMFSPSLLTDHFSFLTIGGLVLAVLVFTGGRYYFSAFAALKQSRATMDSLVALGTGSAWIFSMLVVVNPDAVAEESQHLFFEAALFIIGFVHLGKSIEEYAKGRTSFALTKLLDLQPKYATLILADGEQRRLASSLEVGDKVLVRAGETVPVDGLVLSGSSTVDEQMMTGESLPILKQAESRVTGGTINIEGSLTVLVSEVGANTVLNRLVHSVQMAQSSQPPIAKLSDQISAWFVPLVLVIALTAAASWWLAGEEMNFVVAIFMTVLVVACPCALGLAIPMSVIVGLGRGAELGFLVRHSESLQKASKVDTLVFDKTGTLTEGKPEVVGTHFCNGVDHDEFASIVLSLESHSLHPLAQALLDEFSADEILPADHVTTYPGLGVKATYAGKACVVGSEKFLLEQGYSEFPLRVPYLGSLVFVGSEGEWLGVVVIRDKLRVDARDVMQLLTQRRLKPVLLSGDRIDVVEQLASELRIENFEGELSPEDKRNRIQALQSSGSTVAMVGDGINDAIALSQADVGFAMGAGSDIAIESADITLIGSNLSMLPEALGLAQKVMANIKQNLAAAFVYNVCLIPVAAGVLYPVNGLLLSPSLAGLAMALSSLTVVANATRLRFMA